MVKIILYSTWFFGVFGAIRHQKEKGSITLPFLLRGTRHSQVRDHPLSVNIALYFILLDPVNTLEPEFELNKTISLLKEYLAQVSTLYYLRFWGSSLKGQDTVKFNVSI